MFFTSFLYQHFENNKIEKHTFLTMAIKRAEGTFEKKQGIIGNSCITLKAF